MRRPIDLYLDSKVQFIAVDMLYPVVSKTFTSIRSVTAFQPFRQQKITTLKGLTQFRIQIGNKLFRIYYTAKGLIYVQIIAFLRLDLESAVYKKWQKKFYFVTPDLWNPILYIVIETGRLMFCVPLYFLFFSHTFNIF